MYASFFGFSEPPFNITPDPRFLYLNGCYQEALAALTYGIDARKGFITVIGEAGTGKTTLLRRVLDTVAPSTRTVLLLNPTVAFDEILEHILTELGIPTEGGRKLALLQRLNEFLLEHTRSGGNVALLIDEAQDLAMEVIEELRLLSNLETAREKILQIVLAGQPELEAKLADPRLRQLRQRVTLPIRIRTLAPAEVPGYVRTRLERVGGTDPNLFTPGALERVAALGQGIPRLVNVLCDAALVAAFVAEKRQVTAAMVEEAWRDFAPAAPPPAASPLPLEPPPPAVAPAPTAPAVVPTAEAPVAASPADALAAAAADGTRAAEPPLLDAADDDPPTAEPEAVVAVPVPPPARATFSIPTAIGLVLVLAAVLGALSLNRERMERAAIAAREAVLPAPPPAIELPVGEGPVSPAEAKRVVDAFRAAFEARDADRLVPLFADDAAENGIRGRDTIVNGYRSRLRLLAEVRYTLPRVAIEPRGDGADVRSPFVIAYRAPNGFSGEVRGEAEWALERRDGRPLIVALNYRLEADSQATAAR
ncbi:MAG TPA: AAA family ATPase [Candidatus Binatia bacterium]|jgi:type II secretory pathway predicted ATPase ExeA/ketosteroid isomerase-like protein|nr:AAA family ATPase [Candidatus Binatia bacterium]